MGSTDRKRLSQQEVEESTEAVERLRSVVNHVLDGIITIDHRGTVTTFNPAAERIFGFAASEVIGQNVKMLMPEPYHSQHDGYLASYLQTGEAKIIGIGREVVGRRKDGSTFPMDLAVSEFRLGDERYFTGIVRDITERKRARPNCGLRSDVVEQSMGAVHHDRPRRAHSPGERGVRAPDRLLRAEVARPDLSATHAGTLARNGRKATSPTTWRPARPPASRRNTGKKTARSSPLSRMDLAERVAGRSAVFL